MARIAGVDIPDNKRGEVALTYIYGIGRSRANKILGEAGVDRNIKAKDWNDDQMAAIREAVGQFRLEGELTEVKFNLTLNACKILVAIVVSVIVSVYH